jgi:hypothetical protein
VRRWLSLVLIAAVVISACGEIDPAQHEWCHIYDLDDPMLNLFIDHGEQIPGGGILGEYVGDGNYFYQFEIIEPFNVFPDAMEVRFERGYIAQYNVTVRLPQGTAFGHDISVMAGVGLAPGQAAANYPVTFEFNESDPVGDDRITVQFYTNGDMVISEIAVYGRGVSPYGYTECGNLAATNTPIDQPPTETVVATPTNTPVPSITNTPTITLTPTITNTPQVCQWIRDSSLSSTVSLHNGTSTGGSYTWIQLATLLHVWSGMPSSPFSGGYYVDNFRFRYASWDNTSNNATSATVTFRDSSNATISTYTWNPYLGGWLRGIGGAVATVGSRSYADLTTVTFQSTAGNGGKGFYLTYIEVLVCPNPDPTPTPTPSPTPTNTNTPSFITNTPSSIPPTRTPVPSATRTLTPTNLPPIASPTPYTPPPTWTPMNTLPVPTELPTRTLIPHSTALGTVTAEATFPVPGFGTGAPDITAVSTAPSLGTLEAVDGHSDIYNLLSTAVVEVNDLPGDLTGYVPDPDITPMIGYAKWFLSCSSLYEILGQNVGTMACHAAVGVTLIVIMSSVFIALKIITLVMKFAIWIFHQIRDIIPLV